MKNPIKNVYVCKNRLSICKKARDHLVLPPYRMVPTFLKLDSWSPGAGFVPIIFTKGINQMKKGNCKREIMFYAYKKI